jgi:hypothetical protein
LARSGAPEGAPYSSNNPTRLSPQQM